MSRSRRTELRPRPRVCCACVCFFFLPHYQQLPPNFRRAPHPCFISLVVPVLGRFGSASRLRSAFDITLTGFPTAGRTCLRRRAQTVREGGPAGLQRGASERRANHGVCARSRLGLSAADTLQVCVSRAQPSNTVTASSFPSLFNEKAS